jgi:hypothetical protein
LLKGTVVEGGHVKVDFDGARITIH